MDPLASRYIIQNIVMLSAAFYIVVLSVVMLNVIKLSVAYYVGMLNAVMFSFVMLVV
jgi:hypothetical protein